jgi:hypothetical protein
MFLSLLLQDNNQTNANIHFIYIYIYIYIKLNDDLASDYN